MSEKKESRLLKSKLDIANCESCACLNLRKASRATTQFYDKVLHPSGLRVTQFAILATIVRADAITISKLAGRMVMDRTTLTRNLRPLQQQNLISLNPGTDHRTRLIRIQPAGEAALEKALPLWQTAQQRFVKGLGIEPFHQLLGRLSNAIEIARELQEAL